MALTRLSQSMTAVTRLHRYHFCLALILSLGVLFSSACSTGASSTKETGPPRVELNQELKTKLGPDDGYALALMYGADLGGNLDDCGCKAHPMGGLAWRMGYKEGFRAMTPDVPALQLDAGHMFADAGSSDSGLFLDSIERNKWVLKGYGQAGFAAANVSARDAGYLPDIFKKTGFEDRVKELPFIEKLVSANVKTSGADLGQPKEYLIQEIDSKRAGKTVRVGITGVTTGTAPAWTGCVIESPTEALKRVVGELRGKSDLVVVMAYAQPQEVEKLATDVPGIDVLIGAQSGMGGKDVKKIGQTTVVYTFTQTKELGDLRVYFTPDGKVKDLKNKFVGLDKEIPKDPMAATIVADAKTAIETAQRAQMGTQGSMPVGPGISTPQPAAQPATPAVPPPAPAINDLPAKKK